MDDFGQTYRSTGILVSDRLSLPISVVEPSVVRWRWKLGEGEQMHFTVTFTAAAAEGAQEVELGHLSRHKRGAGPVGGFRRKV